MNEERVQWERALADSAARENQLTLEKASLQQVQQNPFITILILCRNWMMQVRRWIKVKAPLRIFKIDNIAMPRRWSRVHPSSFLAPNPIFPFA